MIKTSRFLAAAAAMATLCATTSCLSTSNDVDRQTSTYYYTDCFNRVYDMQTGNVTYTLSPKYTFEYILDQGVFSCQITMSNVTVGDIPYTTFEFPEIVTSYSSSDATPNSTISTDQVPTNSTGWSTSVVFDDISLLAILRSNSYGGPEYSLTFTVNSRYQVTVFPLSIYRFGTTTSTSLDDYSLFATADPYYRVTFDPTSWTSQVAIYDAQFAEDMPSLNMVFPGIPFTVTAASMLLDCDELTPTISSVEYPDYPITNLSYNFVPTVISTLSFNCQASTVGLYQVDARLEVIPSDD